MMNKKFASLIAAGALITAMSATPAFAATTPPPYCADSSCTQVENHQHDGTTYAAHTTGDGHTYHTACGVSGCTQTGDHTTHNGNHTNGSHRSGGHKSGGHHR